MGVECVVVRDTAWEGGELIERTFDWYAQDQEGTVWYFGEDTKEYRNGKVTSTGGSWEAGVDGAQPGIIMQANPKAGLSYRQEYYEGEAEDKAQVVSVNESVTVPYGSFDHVLKTKEWTPLEPGLVEHKYYAPGVGQVGASEGLNLVDVKTELGLRRGEKRGRETPAEAGTGTRRFAMPGARIGGLALWYGLEVAVGLHLGSY